MASRDKNTNDVESIDTNETGEGQTSTNVECRLIFNQRSIKYSLSDTVSLTCSHLAADLNVLFDNGTAHVRHWKNCDHRLNNIQGWIRINIFFYLRTKEALVPLFWLNLMRANINQVVFCVHLLQQLLSILNERENLSIDESISKLFPHG
jgi:hypothetical protein